MEKTLLSVDQKVEIIHRLVDAGVTILEVGSFVHPKAVPQMADTDEVVRRLHPREGVEYRALVMNLKGVQRALDCGLKKVKLTASASRTHSMKNMNRTPEQVVRDFAECASFAFSQGMIVSGAISTAFGCPFEGVVPLSQAESLVQCFVDIGITEISMSDTSGLGTPRQVFEYMTKLRSLFPQVRWNLHLHNTRGLAPANIVAGMQAGVDVFDASFGGLGGCPFAPGASGNVATEDLLYMFEQDGVVTGLNRMNIMSIAADVCRWLGREPDSFQIKVEKCREAKASER
jgi:hydroxymethylglutaryl-CoA lyase